MKRLGNLKATYLGMFIVMVLKSVSSTPVTSRTGRIKRRSFDGKSEGTRPIVSLDLTAGLGNVLVGGVNRVEARRGVFYKQYL